MQYWQTYGFSSPWVLWCTCKAFWGDQGGRKWVEAHTEIQANSRSRRRRRRRHHLPAHLGLVALAAPGAVVGPLVRVRPHVLANMPDGFVQLAALAALVPPLADMDFHVLLQQVASQELLLAQGALEGLVACGRRRTRETVKLSAAGS